MKLRIVIESDNDAFSGGADLLEFADILTKLANRMEEGERFDYTNLRDSNGNTVGVAALEE